MFYHSAFSMWADRSQAQQVLHEQLTSNLKQDDACKLNYPDNSIKRNCLKNI